MTTESWGARASRGLQAHYLVVAAVVLTAVLGVYRLGEESIWTDEGISWSFARDSLRSSLETEPHSALYDFVLRMWSGAGDSETLLRLPSVAFTTAAVAVVAVLGTRLASRRAGALSAVLLATSPFAIRYAQEARPYALALLLTSASCLCFVNAVQRQSSGWWWRAWCVTSALAVYAHLFAAFTVAGQLASLALLPSGVVPWRPLLRAGTAVAIVVAPLAVLVGSPGADSPDWIPSAGADSLEATLVTMAGGRLFLVGYAILVAAAVAHCVATWRRTRRSPETWRALLPVLWLTIPIAGALAVSVVRPMLVPRYLIVALPGLMLAGGAALARVRATFALTAALLVAALLSARGLRTWYASEKEDWRGAVAVMAREARPGDGVLVHSTGREAFEYYENTRLDLDARLTGDGQTSRVLDEHERVWVILVRGERGSAGARELLDRADDDRELVYQHGLHELTLYLYERA